MSNFVRGTIEFHQKKSKWFWISDYIWINGKPIKANKIFINNINQKKNED